MHEWIHFISLAETSETKIARYQFEQFFLSSNFLALRSQELSTPNNKVLKGLIA
jgi:hypothetical protein